MYARRMSESMRRTEFDSSLSSTPAGQRKAYLLLFDADGKWHQGRLRKIDGLAQAATCIYGQSRIIQGVSQ
jgi:hypothetical protein